MELTTIIQTQFSNQQVAWIICAFAFGIISYFLFQQEKYKYSILFLFLAGLILRILAAGLDPFLWTWDEQYHALVAKNMVLYPFKPMLITNPVLDFDFRNWQENHIWLHKQPFFLWQIALFFKLFGTNEFILRLPSVIMMSLMILLIYRIGRLTSTRAIGWYGAFIYSFTFYFVEFTSGWKFTDHNDAAFIFYITLSIWTWVEYIHSHKRYWLLLTGLFAGIAILNKWLVGLLVYSGWSISIFFCSAKSEWIRQHKKLSIALVVTILTVIPWQIFTLITYPAEALYEFQYNSIHFFTPLEGHNEPRYYHFYLLSEQYGGFLVTFLILPGLYYFFKSMQNKVFNVGFLTFLILTYLFFTLSSTKMPMYCAIVSPVIFLGLGAILDKGAGKLREFIPSRGYIWILCLLLSSFAYYILDINRMDVIHSDRYAYWKNKRINAVIDKHVAGKLPTDDWVVFNCGEHNAVMFMFYSGATAYDYYPDAGQYNMLKSKGIKMATFSDDNIPYFLKNDPNVRKIYSRPCDY